MIPIYLQPPFVLSKRRNAVPAQLLRNWVQIPTSRIMSSGRAFAASNPSVRVRPKFPEKSAPNKKAESERQLWLLVALA